MSYAALPVRRSIRRRTSPRGHRIKRPVIAALFANIVVGLLLSLLCEQLAAAEADPESPTIAAQGYLFRVDLPIQSRAVEDARRFVGRVLEKAGDGTPLVLVFEFAAATPNEAGTTDFAAALGLARFLSGEKLAQAHTVAYIPGSIRSHAVLPAIACNEIMMSAQGRFGPVDAPFVGDTERAGYREIAETRRTIPAEVALWVLDPAWEVLKVQTELGPEYVTPDQLEKLSETATIVPGSEESLEEIVGSEGRFFDGEKGRALELISFLPESRRDVEKRLELRANQLDEDPSLTDRWRAVRVDLKGRITSTMVKQAIRLIEEATRQRDANFICLWIDSPGGSATDSVQLAGFLGRLDSDEIRTVAYIPSEARSDAALIALACDQVVMHPEAILGGWDGSEAEAPPGRRPRPGKIAPRRAPAGIIGSEEIKDIIVSISDPEGPWAGRPQKLVEAMIHPQRELFRCTRLGEVQYAFDQAEIDDLQNQAGGAPWAVDRLVGPDRPLSLDGNRAVEFELAQATAESFREMKEQYGLEDDPLLLEPGWADFLVNALATPGVAVLLLMIAFMSMYIELHSPGLGIGGFVATVCFLLFFWINILGGTAEVLEIMLFLAGFAFLALEIFVVPGFGIFGLGGGCLILASLVLASQTFVFPESRYEVRELRNSLFTVAGAGFGVTGGILALRRWLPRMPVFSRLMLEPPEGEEAERISRREAQVDLEGFVGTRGETTTQLAPSGKARFGDERLDVMTDGEVVSPGTEVEVVQVHGNRLVVRVVDGMSKR